jgi:S-DNA-T family DNA segregation ATPase FtsK/SpoIIIE
MAKKTTTTQKNQKQPRKPISFSLSKQQKILLGSFLALLGIALLFSFTSFLFTWQADQSILGSVDRTVETKNWLSTFGTNIAHLCMYQGFGVAAYIFGTLVTLTGVYFFFDYTKKQLKKFWFWGTLMMVWLSVFFGFFDTNSGILSGVIGFELNDFLQDYMGLIGTILAMTFFAIVYLVLRLKITPEKVQDALKRTKKDITSDFSESIQENKTDFSNETTNNTPVGT